MYISIVFITMCFYLEPILASDEISRAQSLDELHTRLAAIRGKNLVHISPILFMQIFIQCYYFDKCKFQNCILIFTIIFISLTDAIIKNI